MKTPKIAIIGAGAVGSHIAFALLTRDLPVNIILIDKNEDLEEGQFLDLRDTTLFTKGNIRRGDFPDARDADIIINTAGAAQKPGESRTELTSRNIAILRAIKNDIGEINKNTVVLMVANPVDILTYIAAKEWGLPRGQVFGSGTLLDSARLKWHIAEKSGLHPSAVEGMVLGEHGESEFVAWSQVKIAGVVATESPLCTPEMRIETAKAVREEAGAIINRKGATYFGIAVCVAEIVATIIADDKKVLPVSAPLQGEYGISEMALGVPAVVGNRGVERVLEIPLTEEEKQKLAASAAALKEVLKNG